MPTLVTLYLDTLVPVCFVLALGYYAGRRGRLDNRNTGALNTALMHFALPCSLFLAVARTSLPVLRSQLQLVLILAFAMLAVFVAMFLLERRLLRASTGAAAAQSLTVSFSNNVAIGLPLMSSLYGAPGLLAVAAAILTGALVVSPLTLVLMEYDSTPGGSFLERLLPGLLAALRRPVVLAPLVALLIPISGLPLPKVAASSADLLGKATVGVALFLTGLILSAYRPRLSAGMVVGVLAKNLLQPALVAAILLLFHLHGTLAQEAFVLASIPAGFFGTLFSARYGVDTLETSSTLLFSTLAGLLTLPAALALSRYFA